MPLTHPRPACASLLPLQCPRHPGVRYACQTKIINTRNASRRLLVQHALDNDEEPREQNATIPRIDTGMRIAKYYWTAIVDRCKDAAEWRVPAKLLVEDIANVLVVPDWPGAETMARSLASVIAGELSAPLPKKKGALDFVVFLIDALARLVASLKQLEVATSTEQVDDRLSSPRGNVMSDKQPTTEVTHQGMLSNKKSRKGRRTPALNERVPDRSDRLEELLAYQHLVLNAVRDRASIEPWMASAFAYHVARWASALPKNAPTEVKQHLEAQYLARDASSSATGSLRRGAWDVVLPARELAPIARRVFVDSCGLCGATAYSLVNLLAKQLSRENALLRARAVRALDEVVRVDSSLMAEEVVCSTLASRFRDEAISVRSLRVRIVR